MHEDISLPFRSHLANWQVEAGTLTYKGCIYVLPMTYFTALFWSIAMTMRLPDTLTSLKPANLLELNFGGPAWPLTFTNTSRAVLHVNAI